MENTQAPQLLEEAEALIGPFFIDSKELDESAAAELGFKKFAYRSCCRILASARAEDRALAKDIAGYEPQTWNDQWELTVRKMGEIAFRYETETTFIARQLALVNRASQYIEENWEELQARLYPDQLMYMLDIAEAMQKPPRAVRFQDDLGDVQTTDVLGVTAVAPTGFGKSKLIEACGLMIAPGEPFTQIPFGGERPCRLVVVAPSLIIQKQLKSQLSEAFKDIRVGSMTGDEKEPDADIVVSTIEMFSAYFENNSIAGHPVDSLFIDEVHHLNEPIFRKAFLEQWSGMTFGFTATPGYDLQRDVREIIPHVVERANILALIENGRLNNGQIFTFFIDQVVYDLLLERYGAEPEESEKKAIVREVIDTLVIEFITPLLNEGRRGVIFCDQGGQGYYANRFAERLSKIELNDGSQVVAKAMHSYGEDPIKVFQEYKDGKIHALTTVDTGREGMDAEIDFVIINTNLISRLRGRQIVGRGTRKSERFPVTVYAQFANYVTTSAQFEKMYSIDEAFSDATHFEQGRLIVYQKPEKTNSSLGSRVIDIGQYDEIVQVILERINRKAIGETFAGVNRGSWQVLEGMVPLNDIIKGYQVSETVARRMLRKKGFIWRGQYEEVEGRKQLVHYYPPEAKEYLQSILPKGPAMSKQELAIYFGAPKVVISDIINDPKNGIKGHSTPNRRGHPTIRYNEAEVKIIAKALKRVPGVSAGASTVKELAAELGIDDATVKKMAGVQGETRRLVNYRYPLTAAEVARVRQKFNSYPLADSGDRTLMQIAEAIGIDHQVVKRNLTPSEKAAGAEKRIRNKRGYLHLKQTWPAEVVKGIVQRMERFKSQQLPAHLLPSSKLRKLIRKFGVTQASEIAALLDEGGFSYEEILIEGTRSMSNCLSWPAIAYLESVMGRNKGKGTIQLDFNRLPTGPSDLTADKIAYAQQIQRHFGFTQEQQKDYGSIL